MIRKQRSTLTEAMKPTLSLLLLFALCPAISFGQTLLFRCGGTVGSDSNASGIQGPAFGNSGWVR